MRAILERSVAQGDDGYTFTCPGVQGSPCGDLATGQKFTSSGWPTKKAATARGEQHFAEHKGEALMQPLHEFRTDHGLTTDTEGNAVRLEDL